MTRVKRIKSDSERMRHVREFHGDFFDGEDLCTWHRGESELEEFTQELEGGCVPYKIWYKIEYLPLRGA